MGGEQLHIAVNQVAAAWGVYSKSCLRVRQVGPLQLGLEVSGKGLCASEFGR